MQAGYSCWANCIDPTSGFSLECFFALNKKKAIQIAPNTATIRRANVVVSPISASWVESFIPRKITELFTEGTGVIGALVAVGKTRVNIFEH